VGKAALPIRKLALAEGVVDAGFGSQIMREFASISRRTIVLEVQLLADLLGGLGLDDLPLDGVREKAVKTVFAVAHVEVDAGIVAAIDMRFAALA
jgi:hypothetical protein